MPGLQINQLGRHGEEVAGRVQLILGQILHIFEILRRDLGHEDILDVHLRLFDQVQKQIEGSVEILYVYPIPVHLRHQKLADDAEDQVVGPGDGVIQYAQPQQGQQNVPPVLAEEGPGLVGHVL